MYLLTDTERVTLHDTTAAGNQRCWRQYCPVSIFFFRGVHTVSTTSLSIFLASTDGSLPQFQGGGKGVAQGGGGGSGERGGTA